MFKLVSIFSAFISLLFVYYGVAGYRHFQDLIRQQTQINLSVEETRATWDNMQTVRDDWERAYKSVEGVSDIYEVYQLANIGATTSLSIDESRLWANSQWVNSFSGNPIGLMKVCLQNAPGGMVGQAKTPSLMITDLRNLEKRRDISFSHMTVINQEGFQSLLFHDLCLYLRTEDDF